MSGRIQWFSFCGVGMPAARKNILIRRGIILLNRCIPARCQRTMAFSGASPLAVPTRCWSRWEKRRLTGKFRIFKKRMKLEMQRWRKHTVLYQAQFWVCLIWDCFVWWDIGKRIFLYSLRLYSARKGQSFHFNSWHGAIIIMEGKFSGYAHRMWDLF